MTVATPSPPYSPLESRPEATSLTVRELLQRVRAGKMRVPSFQRPLRWSRRQNRELLDSLWRGYPIGALLLWKKGASAGTIQIGAAEHEVGEVADALWVVDGQQRLTALAATLLDVRQPPGEHRWELFFDAASCEFVEAGGRTCVPIHVLGDLRRLGQYLRTVSWGENTQLVDAVEDAQQRLLDYSIPVYIVDADNEDALRAIFARMNSTGARMRTEEVFHALFSGRNTRHGLDLKRLQETCDREGFGMPPRSEVLKMVLAMSGEDPTHRVERLSEEKLANLAPANEAEEVVARVVTFLKESAGIPHVRLIPYPVVLAILSRWFREFPETSAWNLKRLSFWLWRGAARAIHQRAEVSKMREQLRFIEKDESASLARLLGRVGEIGAVEWRLAPFNGQSAHSRIETLAMLDRGPLSIPEEEGELFAGAEGSHPIDYRVLTTQTRVAREIFASRDWDELDGRIRELARSGANRVLLEEGHTGLQSQLRRLSPERHAKVLESHLIDAEAFDALQRRDISAFLLRREQALKSSVAAYLERQCGFQEPIDLAPVGEYLERVTED